MFKEFIEKTCCTSLDIIYWLVCWIEIIDVEIRLINKIIKIVDNAYDTIDTMVMYFICTFQLPDITLQLFYKFL